MPKRSQILLAQARPAYPQRPGETADEWKARLIVLLFSRQCLHDPDLSLSPVDRAQLRHRLKHLPHMTWAEYCKLAQALWPPTAK